MEEEKIKLEQEMYKFRKRMAQVICFAALLYPLQHTDLTLATFL